MTEVGKSLEVMAEEFYDGAAWLRDLRLPELPPYFSDLTLTLHFPTKATVLDPETEEVSEVDALVEVEVMRFDDGQLHVHGPKVCVDIDMDALAEKRPQP